MAEVLWYYARNDQQFGPVTASELKQLVDAGRLSPDDLLWREGMDAWTTAINLRGLFADEQPGGAAKSTAGVGESAAGGSVSPRVQSNTSASIAAASASLRSTLRATQAILWILCVLVVLAGVVLFTRAFLIAPRPEEEAAAGAVFSTFFIGAYVLARCGEKLSKLLLAISRRRSR